MGLARSSWCGTVLNHVASVAPVDVAMGRQQREGVAYSSRAEQETPIPSHAASGHGAGRALSLAPTNAALPEKRQAAAHP
jgi:hypothetical protein